MLRYQFDTCELPELFEVGVIPYLDDPEDLANERVHDYQDFTSLDPSLRAADLWRPV